MCRKLIYLVCSVFVLGLVMPSVASAQEPLVIWAFDEGGGTTAMDGSGNGYDGAITGCTWSSATHDVQGFCLDFAGGDYVLNNPAGAAMNGWSALTVALWVKSDVVGTDAGFIIFYNPSGQDYRGFRYDNEGSQSGNDDCLKCGVETDVGGWLEVESSANVQTTDWQHLAMTWEAGRIIYIYINGERDMGASTNQNLIGGTLAGYDKVLVGKGAKDDGATEGWDGLIDEVAVYDTVLSEEQIQELMQGIYPTFPYARNPSPADGTKGVGIDVTLSWSPGDEAVSHDVYFGTDEAAVTDAAMSSPEFKGSQTATTYPLAGLEMGTTYYWRIDEVNDADTWKGDIWSFTTTGKVYYVDADAEGANNGSSWTDAYRYLQDALATAASGDEIWVAQGIYKPAPAPPLPPPRPRPGPPPTADREATFQLKNGVTLKGGYAGFGQPDPNARDIDVYETILSGDLLGNDGPDFANNYENSYHVITGSGTDETAVLDGFTIIGGRASGSYPPYYGGGMYNYSGSPTVNNCTFSNNSAKYKGGGMYNWQSSPTLTNCIFSGNWADRGGGMGNWQSSPTLTNCIFSGNWADRGGGGILSHYSGLTMTNCIIIRNTAEGDGGGIYCRQSSPIITNCTIAFNTASRVSRGGGMCCDTSSSPTVSNCILWGNKNITHPEIYVDGSSTILVSYTDVQGGWPGTGNINTDPLFTSDYHLKSDSPCIDTGDPCYSTPAEATDIDGEQRTYPPRVDMGPDEFIDTDSDGLPDWWEDKYFGSPVTTDPNANPDYDGWTNIQEYIHGSDPTLTSDYYVAPVDGNDDWDGLAPVWDGQHGPKRTIQAAIDAYPVGQVILTPATYTGDGNRDIDFKGKPLTVRSINPEDPNVVAATVIDCQATGNDPHRGFNFHSNEDSYSILAGLTIVNGCSESGGAILCDSSPTITRCNINGNIASHGGGISAYRANITNCAITGNSAYYGGGLAGAWGQVINCIITGNYAGTRGGGLYGCNGQLNNCIVRGNSANESGGGIYLFYDSPSITNCTITGNRAASGGAIAARNSTPTIRNCTISENSAYRGGGIYDCGGQITNCILWGNRPQEIVQGWAVLVNYSDVQGGWSGIGNIDADPCFVEPGCWDDNGTPDYIRDDVWVEGDYHLLPDSPCINAGDPNYVPEPNETDLDGNPRVIGGRIDMGAYEYPNTAPVACIVGGDRIVEAEGSFGARVTLDGSCSSDADSTAGTNDDIAHFDWYKVDACDPNFEDFIASGEVIDCNLPLGEHIIVLEVIDKAGAFDTNEVTIIVQDTTPPDFTLSVTPTMLWPANHKMVLITPTWTASDICDASPEVSLVSITMNEGDDTVGDGHTTDDIQVDNNGLIYLRAERSGSGSGRIYTITYQAVDDCGNAAVASATVTVPHDQR